MGVESAADRRAMLTDRCVIAGVAYPCQFDRVTALDLDVLGSSYTLTLEATDAKIAAVTTIGTVIGQVFPEFDSALELGPFTVRTIIRDVVGQTTVGIEEQ